MSRLDKLRKSRLNKLEKIRKLGIDPYPARLQFSGRVSAKKALKKLGKNVVVAGRLMAWREHGGSIFSDLEDDSGKVQLFFKKDILGKKKFEFLELLDVGDFIEAKGKVFKTVAGETTVEVKDYNLLTKSIRPLPSKWHGLKDVEERYRQRYVDLIMNPKVRQRFLVRTKVLTELRKFLDSHGFVEVETPILQPMYGGASAKPFITHHNALDCDLYLRISDELYLKRLIVGGFEKVYEVSKDFRNEGIDRQHNPEFTQIEFYWAYATYEDLMKFTEEMLTHVIKKVLGKLKVKHEDDVLDFTLPWKRITFREAMLENTGIDIDKANTEKKLWQEIKKKKVELDLEGVVGYGALLDEFYKKTLRPTLVQPTFLLDYPVEMIALAKRKEEDQSKIASLQLLIKSFEMITAYNELNDPLDQKERWLEMERLASKGLEEYEPLDKDYIRALEYGMPPTAGWGMGIDRFCTFLTDVHTLKEIILFPTMRPQKSPMDVGARGGKKKKVAPGISSIKEVADIFKIDDEVRKRFPSVTVGVAIIEGVQIRKKDKKLQQEITGLLNSLKGLTTEEIGEYPEVKSYRKIYKETGIDWHSRRPSPEALLRRIAKGKGLYSINTCVDAYNLIVMKNRISIGAFDCDDIKFPTVLRFARKGEKILLLGDKKPTEYKEGELAYFDQIGGYNIDFNYRDAQRTLISEKTKNLLINTEGVYEISRDQVERTLKETINIIVKYCGGKLVKKLIVE
jgi:lysyl-tRNA synthetase class 2